MWPRPPSSEVSEIKLVFSILPERPTPNFPPSWNVAPTDSLPVVRYDTKVESEIDSAMRPNCRTVSGFGEGRLDPFIGRGLGLLDIGHLRGMVLLLRIDHTGTAGRSAIMNQAAAIWTCCWRPRWIPGTTGNGRWWCVWVLWLPGTSGPPVNRFLEPAELRAAGVWPTTRVSRRNMAVTSD